MIYRYCKKNSCHDLIPNSRVFVCVCVLIGKPTGKRPLGRPRRRWEGNIRMDLKEIGINTRNWIDSAQDRNYW